MYERSVLILVSRVVAGVLACGILLVGWLASQMGGFNQQQLAVGLVLSLCLGWFAFRQRAQVRFVCAYSLSMVAFLYFSAPWLAFVNAVDSLKPGASRQEVAARLRPWVREQGILDGTFEPNWMPILPEFSHACRRMLTPPEAVTLHFSKDRLQRVSIQWD